MNKKGFTLIELLAVILILGIIALIAIPAISDVISDAKEGSEVATLNHIIKAYNDYYELETLKNHEPITDFIVTEGGTTTVKSGYGTDKDNIDYAAIAAKIGISGDISKKFTQLKIVDKQAVVVYTTSDGLTCGNLEGSTVKASGTCTKSNS